MERGKQSTKDRGLVNVDIFGRTIFYVVQEDRGP